MAAAALAILAIPGYLAASVPAALAATTRLNAQRELLMTDRRRSASLQTGGASAGATAHARRVARRRNDEFFKGALAKASLETWPQEPGVTKQTLLRHFGSKDGLIEAAIRGAARLYARNAHKHRSVTSPATYAI